MAAAGRLAVAGATGRRAVYLLHTATQAYELLRAPGAGPLRRRLPGWWVRYRMTHPSVSRLNPAVRLTPAELAGVLGWPVGNPSLPGVRYQSSPRLPLDRRILRDDVDVRSRSLGRGYYPGQEAARAVLPPVEALRHLHVLGPSGTGKSTLLCNLALRDLKAGRNLLVVDPKGDLVTDLVARLPERARERTVVLDPTDTCPVGFNPLSGGSAGVEAVLHVLRSIWDGAWGPRLEDVLHVALLTLGHSPGHALTELPLLLTDRGFRRPLVAAASTADPLGVGRFWPWYESLSEAQRSEVLAPVMRRLRGFLLRPALRAVLGQTEPRFDFNEILRGRASLLVRLPKGALGGDGAQLIGSLLVAHLWRLSQQRIHLAAERRVPLFFYLDEFQEFLRLPLDLSDALVTARGYGIGLVLAHQHLGQLDGPVRAAVLANVGSRVAFRLDHDDAATIAKRSDGRLNAEALSGLPAYEAYASLLTDGDRTPYGSLVTEPLPPPRQRPEVVLAQNRDRWGVSAADTEARLRRLLEAAGAEAPPGLLGGRRVGGER